MTKADPGSGATGPDQRATDHGHAPPGPADSAGPGMGASRPQEPPPGLPPPPPAEPPTRAADDGVAAEPVPGEFARLRSSVPPVRGASAAAPAPAAAQPRGGLHVGSPFGVPVFVGPTWFLVAAVITVVFAPDVGNALGLGASRYLVSFLFAVLLYASVLAHELSHSVVALRLGMRVRRITLHFLGGVSEIENEPDAPGHEFAVAAAGPALSLALAGIGWGLQQIVRLDTVPGVLVFTLTMANLLVAAFNLLPGLPLDGGRLLRAVVWKISGRPFTGTLAAVWGGRLLGAALVVVPLVVAARSSSPSLVSVAWGLLIGGFVWLGATQSLRAARLREVIPRLRVSELVRRAVAVTADVPLAEALRRAEHGLARAVVVVDHDGRPRALVDAAAASSTPPQQRPWVEVGACARMLRPGLVLSVDLAGDALLTAIQAVPAPEYLVVDDDGGVRGVLARADVDALFAHA